MDIGLRKYILFISFIGTAILLSQTPGNAKAIKVYKWRGAHGVIHYSQVPPKKIHTNVHHYVLPSMAPVNATIVRADQAWSKQLMTSIYAAQQTNAPAEPTGVVSTPRETHHSPDYRNFGWGISESQFAPYYWDIPPKTGLFDHQRIRRARHQPHQKSPHKTRARLIHNILPSGPLHGHVPKSASGAHQPRL